MPGRILVEACVDGVESALAAERGGADRVELCADLAQGGTTPSGAAIAVCRARLGIPVHVLVRPRGGDFHYTDLEFEVMRRDVQLAKELGAQGVVIGLLRGNATVDVERARALIEVARPLSLTFHRAFDVCRDAERALEDLMGIGADRVLTSGQAATAAEGGALIARLVRSAGGEIGIIACGGINGQNVARLVAETRVREVHLRGASLVQSDMEYRPRDVRLGAPIPENAVDWLATDPARIRAVVTALAGPGGE
jgi:copper homeostasis protein